MRYLAILLTLVFAVPAFADGDLTTPINQPVVNKFRVAQVNVNHEMQELQVIFQKGYLVGEVWFTVEQHELRITDTLCSLDMTRLIPLSSFPAAYRTNPFTTFTTATLTQANTKTAIENWIKNTAELGL